MKIPRDISGTELLKKLEKIGYSLINQRGSHIRLIKQLKENTHRITIPNHNPIKIGTLNSILTDISDHLQISKEELIKQLFK